MTEESDFESVDGEQLFRRHPLPWRSEGVNQLVNKLDRRIKVSKRSGHSFSPKLRVDGSNSITPPPKNAPTFAVKLDVWKTLTQDSNKDCTTSNLSHSPPTTSSTASSMSFANSTPTNAHHCNPINTPYLNSPTSTSYTALGHNVPPLTPYSSFIGHNIPPLNSVQLPLSSYTTPTRYSCTTPIGRAIPSSTTLIPTPTTLIPPPTTLIPPPSCRSSMLTHNPAMYLFNELDSSSDSPPSSPLDLIA